MHSAERIGQRVSKKTRCAMRLVEHINVKNQDVKSRRLAGLIEKIPHL